MRNGESQIFLQFHDKTTLTQWQGIMYLDLVLVFSVLKKWPNYQRYATVAGLLVMCLALALSSFSRNTGELIASQGVIYAIGGSFAYSPCILYMDEWFHKRKGLAYGSKSPFDTKWKRLFL